MRTKVILKKDRKIIWQKDNFQKNIKTSDNHIFTRSKFEEKKGQKSSSVQNMGPEIIKYFEQPLSGVERMANGQRILTPKFISKILIIFLEYYFACFLLRYV